MKFLYCLLIVAFFAACTHAEDAAAAVDAAATVEVAATEDVAVPATAENKQNWLQGLWNKMQEMNPIDDMINHLKQEYKNFEEGKANGKNNQIVEQINWIFENKDKILKTLQKNVENTLNNIKNENPVCQLISSVKHNTLVPADKKVKPEQMKPVLAALDKLIKSNDIANIFYGPISAALNAFNESNPICAMLSKQEKHPIFAVIKNLAKVNPLFATLMDIYNESKVCLCAIGNPAEFAMEVIG